MVVVYLFHCAPSGTCFRKGFLLVASVKSCNQVSAITARDTVTKDVTLSNFPLTDLLLALQKSYLHPATTLIN